MSKKRIQAVKPGGCRGTKARYVLSGSPETGKMSWRKDKCKRVGEGKEGSKVHELSPSVTTFY